MSTRTGLTRRTLIKVIGGAGATLVLGSFTALSCADVPKKRGPVYAPNAFVSIDPDGFVTVTICRSDMGQGVRTSLAMLVAEELDADWSKIKVIQATADPKTFGGQGTGGSSSVRSMSKSLRQIGASTRAVLVAAAAKQWGVDPALCKTSNGKVISPDGSKTVGYGELTALAAAEPPAADIKLKDPSQFKLLGKGATRIDNMAVVTGGAIYGMDAKTPGMVFAVIARPPAFGGTLDSVDDTAARKVPGVLDVFKIGNGVAVLGANTWACLSGRSALKIQWSPGPNAAVNTASIHEALSGAAIEHQPMPDGSKVVEATYEFPFLAHATMEPMNALADVKDDRCTVWTATQVPDGAQRMIMRMLNLPQESVQVNVTLLGGGFGRRLQTDFISEAVQLSKTAKRPVKLIWSREDDMKNDFYRGACYQTLKGALDSSGKPVAWSHQALQAGQRRAAKFGGSDLFYDIPNAALLYGGAPIPVPTGPWRSVENTVLNVANEMFIDELARAAGKDPLAFRLELISDQRLKNVLQTAATAADWGKPLPAGWGRGIACFRGYGSYAAHVVELSVTGNKVTLHRVVAVVDCGLAVNPKGVEAQIQGACVDGLSTALRAAITIDKGGVVQDSWTDFKWMTMDAMPKLEVHIVSGGPDPGGMGEVGYPSVPPAVANAIVAATGKRVRKFPIKIAELA